MELGSKELGMNPIETGTREGNIVIGKKVSNNGKETWKGTVKELGLQRSFPQFLAGFFKYIPTESSMYLCCIFHILISRQILENVKLVIYLNSFAIQRSCLNWFWEGT